MSQEPYKDVALNEWLSSLEGEYRQKCNLAFNHFKTFLKEKCGWKEVSGDIILSKHLENRKSDDKKLKYFFDDLMPVYMMWFESQGSPSLNHNSKKVSHNYVVTNNFMVRSFFKYHREPLQVQGRIRVIEVKKKFHAFTKDELTKMAQVGDLEEKAIIMLGVQLGIRVGDFVSLNRKPILEAYKDSNGEFPLEFQIETEKENVISIGHISKEVYDTLKLYWASKPESEFVFPSNGGHIFISEDRANDVLKNCWVKAYPDRKDVKIRFHELRSYKISALTNIGANTWAIMKMTGKKVSSDINVYLTGVNLREVFMKGEQALTLTYATNNNHSAIEELKNENTELKSQVQDLRGKISDIEAGLVEIKKALQAFLPEP